MVLMLILSICTCFGSTSATLNPIVIVPGDGGCQLEAKLNKTRVVHYFCQKKTDDYFSIWLNMEQLVPLAIDCWIDNLRLVYNNITRKVTSPPGVTIRVPGFGGTESIEWLDPSHASTGAYFYDIVTKLVNFGYQRNKTIKGAPYDFRKVPYENDKYFFKLKNLIEDTYEENEQMPIILMSHSMGGVVSLMFLNKQSQCWKDKYIRSMVSLSGVWGGSVKAVKVYAVGDDLGSYFLRESVLRQEQITSPSLAFLLPSKLFWNSDEVLVETITKNYTINDLEDFFKGISFPTGWEMRKDTEPYQLQLQAPGVEVHCLYGTGVETIQKLYYKSGKSLHDYPTLIYGDGDGTVNTRSLEGCLRWRTQQHQKVYAYKLPRVDHFSILYQHDTMKYLNLSLLGNDMHKKRKKIHLHWPWNILSILCNYLN